MTTALEATRPPPDARTLGELILSGDCACANAEGERLASIARLLALSVAVPDQIELEMVAHLAETDIARAIAAWSDVTGRLLQRGVVRARGTEAPAVQLTVH